MCMCVKRSYMYAVGSDLDARTRAKLWQNGWDFNHGTGHGIGYFLNVHEGPGRIAISFLNRSPLYDGMFFSDGRCIAISFLNRSPLYDGMFFSDGTRRGLYMYMYNVHIVLEQIFQMAHAFCTLERIVAEPGYYEEGSFGIRLETIVEVVVKDTPVRNLYLALTP